MTRREAWLLASVVVFTSLALAVVAPSEVVAQAPAQAPAPTAGVITGEVRAGEGAEVILEGVPVQLVELGREPRSLGETRAIEGRFRFEIPAVSASATYIVSASVDGVTYLASAPLLLSQELPEASTVVTVWPATSTRPALRGQLSGLTVVFVDVGTGEVTLQREDLVLNPTAAAWLGNIEGVTLHVPVPRGARSREVEAWYDGLPTTASFSGDAEEVAARVPLRPGVTLVTTRYRVVADLAAPEVNLELVAALPTDELRILAPGRFARALLPGARAVAGESITIEDERVLVVESRGAAEAGQSISARVEGLGGRIEANPLSDRRSAAFGFVVVLLIVGAGAHLASRVRRPDANASGAAGQPEVP